jgi:hypothetical protein
VQEQNTTNECWLPVVGYEGSYEVSDHGRVRSVDRLVRSGRGQNRIRGRVLRPWRCTGGYLQVSICRDGQRRALKVHHLVLEAHDQLRPTGAECRHMNGSPEDNRIENLAWGSRAENMADRAAHGGDRRGEKCQFAKLTRNDVRAIRRLVADGHSRREAAGRFGVSMGAVDCIITRKTWGWLD